MSTQDTSIKDPETYETLHDKGYDKSKAAAIANAQANEDMAHRIRAARRRPTKTGSKDDLFDRAQDLEIEGRSTMTKDELIAALRA